MQIETVESWKDGASPQAWANGRIYYIKRRVTNGVFDGWSALPDGSDEICHTDIPAYPATTHCGISDVTADGKYAVLTVERSGFWPFKPFVDGDGAASPGRGIWNDIWIQNLLTNQAWKVRSVATWGAIWPRFSPDGTRLAWSELREPELWLPGVFSLGKWNMHTANIVWTSKPSLTNIKKKETDGFIETYAFTEDNARVLFAGDQVVGKLFDATSICDMQADLLGPVRKLSPDTPTAYWQNYNEFAYWIPETDKIMFARIAKNQGSLEYWTMNRDGTEPERLSYFSEPDNAQYQAPKSVVGGAAFNPDNPRQFVYGYATDMKDTYKSGMVTLS